jgi:hypothetical protein
MHPDFLEARLYRVEPLAAFRGKTRLRSCCMPLAAVASISAVTAARLAPRPR